ncbi:hypothetical protein EMWEY_00057520, partial [Eimeria maxima]
MDAENFAKLTAILDLLDRCKKNLAQAVQLETPVQVQHALQSGRTLSKRSTRSEGLLGFGSANDGLDEDIKDCVVSRGMMRIFDSRQSTNKRSSEGSDCEAHSDCLDYMAEKSFGPPDVDWEDSTWQPPVPSGSFENLSSDDYANLRPQILGQLFDRILDCLQNDFDELNVHLKQDVISLRKKLQDAVETNDDQ